MLVFHVLDHFTLTKSESEQTKKLQARFKSRLKYLLGKNI